MKFKLPPKPGEGTRERKPSKYGEGGRALGGEARKSEAKKKLLGGKPLTLPKKKPVQSSAVSGGKGIQTRTNPSTGGHGTDQPSPSYFPTNDSGVRDVPEPGANATALNERVENEGRSAPKNSNPFAKLRDMTTRITTGEGLTEEEREDTSSKANRVDDFLDSISGKKKEIVRPTRTREERLETLKQTRERAPTLRRTHKKETPKTLDEMTYAELRTEATKRGVDVPTLLMWHPAGEPLPPFEPENPSNESGSESAIIEKRALPIVVDDEGTPAPNYLAEQAGKGTRETKYTESQEIDMAGILNLPTVVCNNCPMAERCTEFKPDHTCAYDTDLAGLPSRDLNNALPFLELVADIQKSRGLRAYMLEQRQTGGILDPNVTRQLEVAAAAYERVAKLKIPAQQSATKGITVVQRGGEQGPGLLTKLIAAVSGQAPPQIQEKPQNEIVINPEPVTAITIHETKPLSSEEE